MQQHGTKYFAGRPSYFPSAPPPPIRPLRWGQKIKVPYIQNMVMLQFKFKRFTSSATQHKVVCLQTPTPGMGSIGQNSTFSENGHVAYKIKKNHEGSNMVPNMLPVAPPPPPPPTLGMGQTVNVQIFRLWSCCLRN